MSQFDYKLFYERLLPHYQPPGATLFLTFRKNTDKSSPMPFEL